MWGSREEFHDLCLSNLFSLIAVLCLGWWIGFELFLSLYSIVLCLTASSLIYVFYVQHIFESSYANPSQGWSPMRGALEGSSLLVLPPLLQWFTANIGFHNIHHLCERIPNYNLEACHQQQSAPPTKCSDLDAGNNVAMFEISLVGSRQSKPC